MAKSTGRDHTVMLTAFNFNRSRDLYIIDRKLAFGVRIFDNKPDFVIGRGVDLGAEFVGRQYCLIKVKGALVNNDSYFLVIHGISSFLGLWFYSHNSFPFFTLKKDSIYSMSNILLLHIEFCQGFSEKNCQNEIESPMKSNHH